MDERERINAEINALKNQLEQTDFQLYKVVESLVACTSITGILTVFRSFLTEYGPLVANRTAWRARINELEQQLEVLPASGDGNGE